MQDEESRVPKAETDAIVVGVGSGGSVAAANLVWRGVGALLLEESHFPCEKVCGDGFTPHTIRALVRLGIDTSEKVKWLYNKGLRVYDGQAEPFQLDWPKLVGFPPYGLMRKRTDLDDLMAKRAAGCGAELVQGVNVTGAILDDHTGRIVGVRTRDGDEYRAPLVVAADGNLSRLLVSMGLNKRSDRPMEVAYRAYYRSPCSNDDCPESWLELWDGKPRESTLMSGYGWVFGMDDGTCNVGLGVLNTSRSFQETDYQELMKRWLVSTPGEWGFRGENRLGRIQEAALPMAFNRQPVYGCGLLLVGDSGGMVNPFNGEEIAYATESAELAADAIAQVHTRGIDTESTGCALHGYRTQLKVHPGGYYRLGTIFVKLIGDPRVMHLCITYGLSRKTLMRSVMELLANLTDSHGGDVTDCVISALCRVAPVA